MLSDPNFDSPANVDAAVGFPLNLTIKNKLKFYQKFQKLFRENPTEYRRQVRKNSWGKIAELFYICSGGSMCAGNGGTILNLFTT
jgi:hypothetical protein